MPQRQEMKRWFESKSDGSGIDRLNLAFGVRGLDVRLGVPDWIEPGDTPSGEPAIWWKKGPTKGGRAIWKDGGTASQAFWAFLELSTESRVERFVEFARRFGPLGLWEFRTPDGHAVFEHSDGWVPCAPEGIWSPDRFSGELSGELWKMIKANNWWGAMYEPVSEWRRWASWFTSALRIGTRLRRSQLGERKDWETLGYSWVFEVDAHSKAYRDFSVNIESQRTFLSFCLERRFLQWAGLIPIILWTEPVPKFTLAYRGENQYAINLRGMRSLWPINSLYPSLVLQLLALISNGNVATCESCGAPHGRTRNPRSDQPVHCLSCRRIARNESNARSARKRRSVSREASSGST